MRLLQRHFWLVGAGSALLCCVLAARAVNHVVEAQLTDDSARIPDGRGAANVPPTPAQQPGPQEVKASRSARGTSMTERNMFCSDCVPEEPASIAGADESQDPIPVTSLPLELLATSLSDRDDWSYVTVRDTASGAQGAFWAGQPLPGAGAVEEVRATYVVFQNPATGRRERLPLASAVSASVPASAAAAASSRRDNESATASAFADRVRKIDDSSYEVDKGLIPELLTSPQKAGARVRPAPDGGFKLFGVQKGGLADAVGFRSGDTIQAINGMELKTPDQMLAVYAKVKDLTSVEVAIQRGGKPVTLRYNAR
jgi:general secretion pathway protein C